MDKIEQFTQLVKAHDLTYDWSDDSTKWRAGDNEYRAIQRLAMELPRLEVVRIWNSVVDEKIRPELTHQFYWSP